MINNSIPEDIIKIQKKLASLEKDSRNYRKYTKILAKHIKSHTMKKRVLIKKNITKCNKNLHFKKNLLKFQHKIRTNQYRK